jgi:HipA-like protein
MPLDRLVAVQYVRRFTTASRPFEGYAEDANGVRRHVCIKPLLRGSPHSGSTLAAEVLGAHIAAEIGVPVPVPVLVEVEQGFIVAAGGALSDVEPGLAFGSTWVEASFPAAQGATTLSQMVVNPESVSGVTVLDTLTRNTDRHLENALLVPASGRPPRFRLVFIDNAFGHGFSGSSATPLALCVPQPPLAALIIDQQTFNPFLLAVEGLSIDLLRARADEIGACGWGLPANFSDIVVQHVQWAAPQIRPLILSGLPQFPNCR